MSTTTALLIIFVLRIAIGVVAALVMGRRGHAPFAARRLERRPETVTPVGRPDEALVQHAREHSFGLVVIAPRGDAPAAGS